MKVAFLGNFSRPFTSESHFTSSLQDLGHQVVRIQEGEWATGDVAKMVRKAEPDLFIWTMTKPLADRAGGLGDREQMLEDIKAAGVTTAAIHLDKYVGLPRVDQVGTEAWWQSQYVFSADGGNQDFFRGRGVNHYWFRPGVYAGEMDGGVEREHFRHDVVFVGSVDNYHPEWAWRREMVDFLTRRYGLVVYPQGKAIRQQELADLYASARVVVGDSIFAGQAVRYTSDRPYETVGRAGFLVQPLTDGLDRDFTGGKHLIWYNPGDIWDLAKQIDHYLPAADFRDQVRYAGREHVRALHTYAHRMQEVLYTIAAQEAMPDFRSIYDEVFVQDVYRAAGYIEPGDRVVDLGAHVGSFSVWAAHRGAKVTAVEAHPEHVRRMTQALEADPFAQGRIRLIHAAVGVTGKRAIVDGSGHNAQVQAADAGDVPVLPLSDAIGDQEVAFLKSDVEHAEFHLFTTTPPEILARCRHIAMEFHGTELGHPIRDEEIGLMLRNLSRTHSIEILGSFDRGGYIFCHRF